MSTHTQNSRPYPNPVIPLAPIMSGKSFTLSFDYSSINSILTCSETLHITSGRAGIALALEHAGVAQHDEVLIPAYHSKSMIPPVYWREALPVFYQVNMDTSINNEDIENKITPRTKAIIVTHYFGILQNLSQVRTLCDQRNIILIEDCAHAFFGAKEGVAVGTCGDYAIASSMKFFPCFDGGVLASSNRQLSNINLQPQPLSLQLKAFFNIIERAVVYERFGFLGTLLKGALKIKELAWTFIKKISKTSRHLPIGAASSEGGFSLDKNWIHKKISLASMSVIKTSHCSRIIKSRIENYQKIHEALKNLSGAHPLFEEIDDNCVPMVYPLFVENPEPVFDRLKRQGVPIWRFGENLDEQITYDIFPNSITLSTHILQFPCHQELSSTEINWMITQIKQAIQ